jgi:hypothetical protein
MQLKGAECDTLDCVGCGTDIHISSVCPHLTRRTRCVVSRTLKQRGHAGKSHSGVLRERPNGTVPASVLYPLRGKRAQSPFRFQSQQFREAFDSEGDASTMPQSNKQYKPIAFGDRPDPDIVEGHLHAEAEAVLDNIFALID